MATKSPHATVKEKFGGRAELVDKLVPMVDDLAGDDKVRSRLMGLPNSKLLRLYQVEQTVRERFGDRDKLVEHILDARRKAGLTADADYQAKLAKFSKARLLDMTRQDFGVKPDKQTPEEKLAKKRGRKQRERAMSKLGKS